VTTFFARFHRPLMFVLGAGGFVHELLRDGPERPFILALCGALMGLPFVLAADNYRVRKANGHDDDDRWSHLP
jgi:hypothetical protein